MEATLASELTNRSVGFLWGDSKVGKTVYACSLPGRKLIINFDPDGFSSVAYRPDVDVVNLANMPASEAIRNAKKAAQWLASQDRQWDSCILDSATTLADVAVQEAVNMGIGKSTKFTPTIEAPGISAYGARNTIVNDIIWRLLRATGQLSMHFWILAHADDPQYDKKGENIIEQTIMLGAKMRQHIGLKASEIWFMDIVSGRRMIYLKPFGVRKPMGSRMFDIEKVQKFELKYDIAKPDEEQPHSLTKLWQAFDVGGRQKLLKLPTE